MSFRACRGISLNPNFIEKIPPLVVFAELGRDDMLITMRQIVIVFFLIICAAGIIVFINMKSRVQYSVQKQNIPKTTQKSDFIIKGSIPYWDQDGAFSSFRKNVNTFDYINLFWYYLGDTGTVEVYKDAEDDKSIIDFAHANRVEAFAVITNLSDKKGATWNSDLVESVIKNKASRAKHISRIIEKIEEFDFDGVTIDYEDVRKSQKENFSSFIEELSTALHQNGKIVAVALHAKTSDSDSGNGAFQDWETLAKYADHLNIMAYGEHWDESSAGPIASVGWVEKIIEYAQSLDIPSEKFILGIPLYGYDWNKDDDTAAKGLIYEDAQNLLIEFDKEEQWDVKSSSSYFFYEYEDENHEVWFENSRSVMVKIELAKKAGFAGVTFWRLGGEDQKVWEAVDSLR